MDFSSLKDSVTNLTLYDIKAGVRKVQNGKWGRFLARAFGPLGLAFGTWRKANCVAAVMNYTEMEAKVREATNNEPWGASSTLMQDIANGTFN
jgi:epsin